MAPLLFLNVGEMSKYEGLQGDTITGGGKNVGLEGYGGEILNFKKFRGRMYGYAHAPHDSINIQKLGAQKNEDHADGVLVIWVAKSQIVGWYKNATVFRKPQPPPTHSGRTYKGHPIKYNATAKAIDCTRIDRDDRHFRVPRAYERKNGMGRYLWHADGPNNAKLRARVLKYVGSGGKVGITVSRVRKDGTTQSGSPRQIDPFKRKKVESNAVEATVRYYRALKYEVDSVERDNVGWDLEATHPAIGLRLRIEVKGFSGSGFCVELTRQEYAMMRKHKTTYRLCVVTDSLSKRRQSLSVFAYNDDVGKWADGDDRSLHIQEVISARLRLTN
jgi:hypothetical protein